MIDQHFRVAFTTIFLHQKSTNLKCKHKKLHVKLSFEKVTHKMMVKSTLGFEKTMGRCQRGVHFGAVDLKRVTKVANFLLQILALLFSYTILKQLCNIMATKTKIIFDLTNFRLK